MNATDALVTEPTALFALLAATLGALFWLSRLPFLAKFFEILPPVIWAYFLPMLLTTAGITPGASPAYDWMSRYLLPIALILLMITVDVPAILRLGPKALLMMLSGTVGVILGGPIALALFGQFLPEDAWKGFAALAGSWIGGTANFVAIKESVGASDSIIGPVIVVDTVVGYGWMGVLLFLNSFQARFDRWIKADTSIIEEVNSRLLATDDVRVAPTTADLSIIVGIALLVSVIAVWVGNEHMPPLGNPTIISGTTWAVLIVVTLGLGLSFTPLRQLERTGASRIGFLALYLLLTSIGARADLHAVVEAPLFLAAGVVWMSVHVACMLIMARILRAPLFFFAAGSMANIGGPASAPVVASVYLPAMAPVGVLMAVLGYILGIYGGLVAAWLLSMVATL